ncbi:ABC-2 type transport system permease protein [Caldanaerobius fijiensis DSM 17918]|uniref:ABC-2 type transport system permease protein n=1 Tax=Caldanaerobius fijiensis DSM 17918 TaxID=1121256 RepID=A0A1M5E2D4_9THEO|nr:ABC transporter permease [Caldanaerobius fijiensis]SHF73389.1 ABC-2 type transport system permease protein [Caldanaerobius fijiensis DSM 17918]
MEVGYIIPKGFSKRIETSAKAKIQVVKLGENQSATTISTIMNGYISKIRTAYITADTVKKQLKDGGIFDNVYTETLAKLNKPAATVKVEEITKNTVRQNDKKSYSPNVGFVVMFVMFMITFAMGAILQEKKEGTWGRLLSTPTSPFEILGGHFLGVFAQGYIQMFILVVLTSILFNTYWGNSYFLLFIVMSAFLLAVMGLGLMLSGFVRTYAQLGALGPIVIVPTSMISGIYWPVDIMPDFMQKLALFMPQYWAMKGIASLVLGGGDFTIILMPVLILLGFAVVFFTIGIGLLRE